MNIRICEIKDGKRNLVINFQLEEIDDAIRHVANIDDIMLNFGGYDKMKENITEYSNNNPSFDNVVIYYCQEMNLSVFIPYERVECIAYILFDKTVSIIEKTITDGNEKYASDLIFNVDCLIEVLEIIDDNALCQNFIDLKESLQKYETDTENIKIRQFIASVAYESSKIGRQNYNNDTEVYAEQVNRVMELIEDEIFTKNTVSIDTYYKNVLNPDGYEEFEKIMKLIKETLIDFDSNLIYCIKIIGFINNEFKEKGVFPQELLFINQFLSNAINTMILSVTKLYFDNANIQNKKDCGFEYLKAFIRKNMHATQGKKDVVYPILGLVKQDIKDVKKLGYDISKLRNSLIAHYDIGNQEEIEKIQVDIETFKKIYCISTRVFENLSLSYFNRLNSFNNDMIRIHGFSEFICKNPWMHNPNQGAVLDIDKFLDVLRKNFNDKLLHIENNSFN